MMKTNKKHYFNLKKLNLLFVFVLTSTIFCLTKQKTGIQKQARAEESNVIYKSNSPYYENDLSKKFQESEVFHLNSSSQVHGFFTNDHRSIQTETLPNNIQLEDTSVTFTDKGGILIQNPLKDEPFYKIEVLIEDNDQKNLTGYLSAIDEPWDYNQTTNGLSVGIDTTKSINTYWYWHNQFKYNTSQNITQEQLNFSNSALSKFIRRTPGERKLEIYVTPVGIYPVVDGANFISFPDLYIGSYTFDQTRKYKVNYIVLGKWNSGGSPVTFRNLKVFKLDNSISNVDEVNAHFIKKTLNSATFSKLVSSEASFNGTNGFQNALWSAFLYRAHDYYFQTNHVDEIRRLVDIYLDTLPSYVNQNISRYGHEDTVGINHSFINSMQSNPLVIYGLSGYLRRDQMTKLKQEFAKIIDESMKYIKTDGSFPKTTQYKGDTFAEENSWLLCFYAGYYVNFPNDGERSKKIIEYLNFLGFHHLSDGKSIQQAYGDNIQFSYLSDDYKNFVSQYIWTDGSIDNHEFHPSLNYSQGIIGSAVIVRNILEKKGATISTLSYNLEKTYLKNIKEKLNINTFRLKDYTSRFTDPNCHNSSIQEDIYIYDSDGSIIDFIGRSKPSLVEDWASSYTNYHTVENYGDYNMSTPFAKNIYYGFYSGAGKLFCGHTDTGNGQRCSAGTENFNNYLFGDALYSMLFSKRSEFKPIQVCEENFFKEQIWEGESKNINISCDNQTKIEGKTSVRLASSQPANIETYSPLINIKPNTKYEVSYWVKTTDLQTHSAQIYGKIITSQYDNLSQEEDSLTQNRVDAGFDLGENVKGTSNWIKKSYMFITDSQSKYVRLRALLGGSGTAQGTVWYDNVTINELDTPPSCIPISEDTNVNDLVHWYTAYRGGLNQDSDLNCDTKINIDDLIFWYQLYRH